MVWDLLLYLLKFNKKKICLINSGKLLNNWTLLGGEKNSNLRYVCHFSGPETTSIFYIQSVSKRKDIITHY